MATEEQSQESDGAVATAGDDTLTITDNRTGKTYEVDITDQTIKAIQADRARRSNSGPGRSPARQAPANAARDPHPSGKVGGADALPKATAATVRETSAVSPGAPTDAEVRAELRAAYRVGALVPAYTASAVTLRVRISAWAA